MADKDIKDLPPEERIRRLKELEKKRKKELAEAEEEIRRSHEELTKRREWFEKVPIPEVIQEDEQGLGEEGRELIRTHRGWGENPKVEEEVPAKRREISLEETLEREKTDVPPEAMGIAYGMHPEQRGGIAYKAVSDKPMTELYKEAVALKQSITEKGYISREDERKAEYLVGVVEQRVEAERVGYYSFTEQTAKAASLTAMVGSSVRNAYQNRTEIRGNDWYQ